MTAERGRGAKTERDELVFNFSRRWSHTMFLFWGIFCCDLCVLQRQQLTHLHNPTFVGTNSSHKCRNFVIQVVVKVDLR